MILDQYGFYENNLFYNFTPNFPSKVTRIGVLKTAKKGQPEISVDRMKGPTTFHRLSELEAILHQTYEEGADSDE